MPVANQLRESMKRSSWIREMFEEGARLKAIHGEDQVHDFSLGNPILEPPQQVHLQLKEILSNSCTYHGNPYYICFKELRTKQSYFQRKSFLHKHLFQ